MREISALKEAMKYFKLKDSKLIVAEGEDRKVSEDGFDIYIIPFYKWALSKGYLG